MSDHTYLVTGSMGCIGAWTLYHLTRRGDRVVSFDISDNRQRLNLLLEGDEQTPIVFVRGDLTDTHQVAQSLVQHNVTRIIHLGALQVPFCRANPILGAQVNVIGTLNVFEAAKNAGLTHVVYASSVAVYGNPEEYLPGLVPSDAPLNPHTLYGGYKQCNEQNARIYAQDFGINSISLRPYIVYGVGRDQGMTSDPTKAMLAAAAGEPYHIGFGGSSQLQLASDVALQFIEAADHPLEGAQVFNLGGVPVSMEAVVTAIREVVPEAEITFNPTPLPFPIGFDDQALRQAMPTVYDTTLTDGVNQTIAHFKRNLDDGRIEHPTQ